MDEDRYTRITLRIPKELHARLESTADGTSKSLNAEIVNRLEMSSKLPTITEIQFLLAKSSYDMADQQAAYFSLGLQLFETALALKMSLARHLHNELEPLTEAEVKAWAADADDAIKAAQEAIKDRDPELSDLKTAVDRLAEMSRRIGIEPPLDGKGEPTQQQGSAIERPTAKLRTPPPKPKP